MVCELYLNKATRETERKRKGREGKEEKNPQENKYITMMVVT